MKTTFNGRRPQNIKSGISQQSLIGSYSNFKLRLRRPKQSVQILQIKTNSYGRRPQNIKSGISQQPLIGSYSKGSPALGGQDLPFTEFLSHTVQFWVFGNKR